MSVESIERKLATTRRKLDGVKAMLLAGTDGRPIAHSLDDRDTVNSTSAVAASSLQLAARLSDLLGDGPLEELTVRSADGYVIVTAIGDRWVLAALTTRAANIARINLTFRDLNPELHQLLAEPPRPTASSTTPHHALPEYHSS